MTALAVLLGSTIAMVEPNAIHDNLRSCMNARNGAVPSGQRRLMFGCSHLADYATTFDGKFVPLSPEIPGGFGNQMFFGGLEVKMRDVHAVVAVYHEDCRTVLDFWKANRRERPANPITNLALQEVVGDAVERLVCAFGRRKVLGLAEVVTTGASGGYHSRLVRAVTLQ